MALGRPGAGAIETTAVTPGAGKGGGIHWYTNPFDGNGRAAQLIVHMYAGLAVYTTGFAARVEQYAKDNAPWDDRSGHARGGLTAKGEQRLVKYTITLYHTVSYGVWLEVRWDGKYAIIVPTIEHMGPELMRELDIVVLAKLGGG